MLFSCFSLFKWSNNLAWTSILFAHQMNKLRETWMHKDKHFGSFTRLCTISMPAMSDIQSTCKLVFFLCERWTVTEKCRFDFFLQQVKLMVNLIRWWQKPLVTPTIASYFYFSALNKVIISKVNFSLGQNGRAWKKCTKRNLKRERWKRKTDKISDKYIFHEFPCIRTHEKPHSCETQGDDKNIRFSSVFTYYFSHLCAHVILVFSSFLTTKVFVSLLSCKNIDAFVSNKEWEKAKDETNEKTQRTTVE